jgi:hypothetical protein
MEQSYQSVITAASRRFALGVPATYGWCMTTALPHFRSVFGSHARAWILLVITAILAAWWILSVNRQVAESAAETQQGGKDLEAYRQIVERVHHGENYYAAAGEELRAGGYATSSVFNWRLPTYAWLLGAFPRPEWGQALLIMLALTALALAYGSERTVGGVGRAIVLLILMLGAFLWCIDGDAFFANEQRTLGIAAGLAALFMRELAGPYVVIALVLACREHRWREVVAWTIGIAAFVVFFVWHAWQVQRHLTGAELAETTGWIQWGGPAFVIRTCQMNQWLFNLPEWAALLFLLASLIGFAQWHGPVALLPKLTVAIYLLAFLMVGKACNNYWGLLFAPLLPWGLVHLGALRTFSMPHLLRSTAHRG